MLKVLSNVLMVASLVGLALPASAQRKGTTASSSSAAGPKYELGADLATQFISRGDNVGGGFQFGAPVDVRWGFLSKKSPLNFEVRMSFAYDSKFYGGDSYFTWAPAVNALYQLKGAGARGRMRAPYLTGGVGLNLVKLGAGGTDTQFGLGAGIGTRLPASGGLVWRPEGYMTYAFASGNLPHAFAIGVRMGMSIWH